MTAMGRKRTFASSYSGGEWPRSMNNRVSRYVLGVNVAKSAYSAELPTEIPVSDLPNSAYSRLALARRWSVDAR